MLYLRRTTMRKAILLFLLVAVVTISLSEGWRRRRFRFRGRRAIGRAFHYYRIYRAWRGKRTLEEVIYSVSILMRINIFKLHLHICIHILCIDVGKLVRAVCSIIVNNRELHRFNTVPLKPVVDNRLLSALNFSSILTIWKYI